MSVKEMGDEEAVEAESPLLLKIKDMLQRTPPEKWKSTGSELNPQQKFTQPRETWEKTYQISIPNGTLVMRCSQPVRSDYFPGGYTYTPVGHPNYTVEVRASGWNAQEIVDPTFKATTTNAQKNNRLDILADGRVAETIYGLVHKTVKAYRDEEKKKFDGEAEKLALKLLDKNRQMAMEKWDKAEKTEKDGTIVTSFTCPIDGIRVEVARRSSSGKDKFFLTFFKEEMSQEFKDAAKAKDIFDIVEDLTKTVRLMALSKVLEDVGF